MAQEAIKSRISLNGVRDSVKKIQEQGERVVGQLREEARGLVSKARVPTLEEARRRAADAVHELEVQRDEVVDFLRRRLNTLLETFRGVLGAAAAGEVAELAGRLARLESRSIADEPEVVRLRERLTELEARVENLTRAA